jgi:membrane-bound ClpP family serine protease
MPWKGPVCLLVIIVGLVLFLYGANYYDAKVGWAGVGLFVGGFLLYVVLKVYERLQGSRVAQKS